MYHMVSQEAYVECCGMISRETPSAGLVSANNLLNESVVLVIDDSSVLL